MSASLSSLPEIALTGLCPHFGLCGGCRSQNVPYEEQIRLKAERVSGLLAGAGVKVPLKVNPSPGAWFYRNKMEFAFGDVYPPLEGGPTTRLGLKERGRWHSVVDLSECRLLSPETGPLLIRLREWAEREKVAPYNSHKHLGILRHLVLREAKNGPGRMAILVTAPGEFPRESFLEALSPYPATTVLRGLNAKVADTALADSLEVWTGDGVIEEILRFPGRELKFRISPYSFFQTNTRGAEVLYGILRTWLGSVRPKAALDLYCGGGGIGLCIADVCGNVLGVETNPAAVADANANAALNGIANASFRAAPVETGLTALLADGPDAVVVDPPRAGLHPKAAEALSLRPPPVLAYVSCNPEALARDLKLLSISYDAERAELVDLFPHTEHVETAVLLRRRN